MDRIDGVTALALVLIASFAIDRIVTGSLFLLSFIGAWDRRFPDPASVKDEVERARAEKKHKLVYFAIAGILGGVVLVWIGNFRILSAVLRSQDKSFPSVNPVLDTIITALLLMGGADRLAQVLKMPGASGGEKSESKPIQITGKLILEQQSGKTQIAAEGELDRTPS